MDPELIIYFSILTCVVISGILKFRLLSYPFKILVLIIFYTLISELIARFLTVKFRNSNPPYHVLCIIQVTGFAIFFSRLSTKYAIKQFFYVVTLVFGLFSCLNTIFIQGLLMFPSNAITLSYIVLILFSVMFFTQMIMDEGKNRAYVKSVFWVTSALLIYSIIMSICLGPLSYLMRHKLNPDIIESIMEYSTYFFYILTGYSIIIDKNKKLYIAK